MKNHFTFLIALFISYTSIAQQLSQSYTFSQSELEFSQKGVFDIVNMFDTRFINDEEKAGEPCLPVKQFKILLPQDAKTITGVSVTTQVMEPLEGSYYLYPIQPPAYLNGSEPPQCVYIIADPTPPTMILSKDISYNWPMMIGECKFSDEIFLEGPGEIGYNMGPVQLIVNPYENVYWLSITELVENKIKIYPNPVIDNLHIESEILIIDTIKIYDIKGNLLMLTDQILGKNVIDLSKLESGIYQMVLSTQNKNLNLKLIKQ